MPGPVKTRTYNTRRRRAAAERTRTGILDAARELFSATGYGGTSIAQVAARAGVSVDTVYASVGRKPQLLLAVHDMELAGSATPVAAGQRDYVQRIRAATSAREKIETYTAVLAERLPQTVPLALALRDAGGRDPECQALYLTLSRRRATNMRQFAQDLLETGELRAGVDVDQIATLTWSMNSPDYFQLLAEYGHTPTQYAHLLTQVWTRAFLPDA